MTIPNGTSRSKWADRAKEWIRYAQSDLRAAERLLDEELVLFGTSCFHAQQAAEKALKAILVFYGIDFPKTHDLVLLSRLLPGGVSGIPGERELRTLTQWSVEARYPGDLPEATRTEACEAIELARGILGQAELVVCQRETEPEGAPAEETREETPGGVGNQGPCLELGKGTERTDPKETNRS